MRLLPQIFCLLVRVAKLSTIVEKQEMNLSVVNARQGGGDFVVVGPTSHSLSYADKGGSDIARGFGFPQACRCLHGPVPFIVGGDGVSRDFIPIGVYNSPLNGLLGLGHGPRWGVFFR